MHHDHGASEARQDRRCCREGVGLRPGRPRGIDAKIFAVQGGGEPGEVGGESANEAELLVVRVKIARRVPGGTVSRYLMSLVADGLVWTMGSVFSMSSKRTLTESAGFDGWMFVVDIWLASEED